MADPERPRRPKDRARRFCTLPGDATITLSDGTVVARSGEDPEGRKSVPFRFVSLADRPGKPADD